MVRSFWDMMKAPLLSDPHTNSEVYWPGDEKADVTVITGPIYTIPVRKPGFQLGPIESFSKVQQ